MDPVLIGEGPGIVEAPLRLLRYLERVFRKQPIIEEPYVEPTFEIVDKTIGATAVDSVFPANGAKNLPPSMSTINPLIGERVPYWNIGNKYSVGDTMYLHMQTTCYIDGKMVSIDTTTVQYR